MSRHYFGTSHRGFPVTVILGWDRPMNYFFLMIEKPAELIDSSMEVEDEDFLYSNLHENDPFNHDLDYYREVLRHFQIVIPESMFIEVQCDLEGNVGNRVADHQADGSFTEREL
ncbi:TPA: hypothetical protein L4Q76_001679 [Pseudomonas aeruginosa]|uniref:hypothetical protein n=1 Tax=Pseudomonas aeruginosa TaxID=287 RepID=UPI0003B9A01C|nr:hypothetical protein [Pseudomonas aeruginosa]EKT9493102.1 hypothetical protein [Pseudomonas aeruginosa]ERY35619.1 hypothetical protein Q067_02254 [Pseudomonas aeruginosa BL13]MBH4028469.1 hypothetical protein [Pseudomonas aeruginosa]MBV5530561.1 hypothetical protein [Pseudomonas aeruginosa]MCS8095394.1 hypothetical protein [Pseudomonas aeruginosa]